MSSVTAMQQTLVGLLIVSFIVSFFYVYVYKTNCSYQHTFDLPEPANIDTCELLDPWNTEIVRWVRKPKRPNCFSPGNNQYLIYVDHTGQAQFNTTLAEIYNIILENLKCTIQYVKRNKDASIHFEEPLLLTIPQFINGQVFRVRCLNNNSAVYDIVQFNPFWSIIHPHNTDDEGVDKLSVIIIGFDSVSRGNAIRSLPKSLKLLNDSYNCFDFVLYNRVGENTWPNLVPLLTGDSDTEHSKYVGHKHFKDSMPFVWKRNNSRLATFYAENCKGISTFNYLSIGFNNSPADYYFRPFDHATDKIKPTLIKQRGRSKHCYGENSFLKLQLDFLDGFLTRFSGKRKFALLWNNDLAHDSFNSLFYGDDVLSEFLEKLKPSGLINRSVVLFMSDHGFRLGGASTSKQGRKEQNNPWFMMHVPNDVFLAYPQIKQVLESNKKRLVSPYDAYQTIEDIFEGEPFKQQSKGEEVKNIRVRRSLFTPIPDGRTCPDAGIKPSFCSCGKQISLSNSSALALTLANRAVNLINSFLQNYELCTTLTLDKIKEVLVMFRRKYLQRVSFETYKARMDLAFQRKEVQPGGYNLVFYTKPGQALFEITIDIVLTAKHSENLVALLGEPRRLNKYGSQSDCINDTFLKSFCFCK